jgi:heme-degrading monooxygenase HmoA
MVARVTLADIDVVRMGIGDATRHFEEVLLPALRERPGYKGVFALANDEGKALVMSLWDSDEVAEAGLESGFYAAQVEEYVTVYRAPPGRETYRVLVAEMPAIAAVS